MSEHDPLRALLREWQAPEPSPELDQRVVSAYREAVGQGARPRPSIWASFWRSRISVPAPVLALGILVAVAALLWYRGPSTPKPLTVSPNVVAQLNATGFQPLPNGRARVLSVTELNTELKK
jgi:anti-sigma-K factor RskA